MVEEKGKIIGFRVNDTEYKEFERIAAILNREGKIRNDTVGSLTRVLCFVKINEFIRIELMQKAADQNEKRLQEMEKTSLGQPS